ncbi:hypothetical protein [Streptomyces sp. NPDC054863]
MKKSIVTVSAACGLLMLGASTAVAGGTSTTTADGTSLTAPAGNPTAEVTVAPAAAPTALAAAATCTLKLDKPWKTAHAKSRSIAGYKTLNSCSGFSLSATLQYHRWHGWSGLDKDTWAGNRGYTILSWQCEGEGNHNYRVAGTVRGGSGPQVGRGNGPSSRFTC